MLKVSFEDDDECPIEIREWVSRLTVRSHIGKILLKIFKFYNFSIEIYFKILNIYNCQSVIRFRKWFLWFYCVNFGVWTFQVNVLIKRFCNPRFDSHTSNDLKNQNVIYSIIYSHKSSIFEKNLRNIFSQLSISRRLWKSISIFR